MDGERAYAEFTRLKNAARAFSKRHDPSTIADCEAAEPFVQRALDFLARPDISALPTGRLDTMSDQRVDLQADLVDCAVVRGQYDRAIALIEASGIHRERLAWLFDQDESPIYAPLKRDPRFRALVDRGRAATMRADRLWNSPSLGSPYREHLSIEEKVAGLSWFWSTVLHDFAYIDRIGDLDWNAVYLQYLTRVIAADTTEDYYRVMMQLAPLLHDGHTNIYPPAELRARFYARPPVQTALVEGHVAVMAVRSASLAKDLGVGDEIVGIDGLPVHRYADERVKPFASASTPQDLDVRLYDYQLLAGDARKSLRLDVVTAAGATKTIDVKRSGYTDLADHEAPRFEMLEGDIAYLHVGSFETSEGVDDLVKHWPEIRASKGLIIDVRDNGGGDSRFGVSLLSRLTRMPVPNGTLSMRIESGLVRAQGRLEPKWLPGPGSRSSSSEPHEDVFDGPVAVLIGPRTFSAAEDFTMSFDALGRGKLYGSPSAGSTGQPLSMRLPGGGSARVCVLREAYPDGREFVGIGIEPTVRIEPSIEDVRAHRDVVLDRALADLRSAR